MKKNQILNMVLKRGSMRNDPGLLFNLFLTGALENQCENIWLVEKKLNIKILPDKRHETMGVG